MAQFTILQTGDTGETPETPENQPANGAGIDQNTPANTEAPPTGKRGRGRPKKEGSETPKKEAPPKVSKSAVESEVERIAREFEAYNAETTDPPIDLNAGGNSSYFTGHFLLLICDMFFPVLISFFIEKKTKIILEARELYLSEEEKQQLEPLADIVAQDIFGTMPPATQFFILITVAYGSKTMTAYMVKKQRKVK